MRAWPAGNASPGVAPETARSAFGCARRRRRAVGRTEQPCGVAPGLLGSEQGLVRAPQDFVEFGIGVGHAFIGLTAYDTQRLKEIHRSGGATEQIAILGALRLYLDFINMFLLLLRLFGRRR
jgi:hypothetical protein